jgi:asparagine synthase (glutamine-hydrolysing)
MESSCGRYVVVFNGEIYNYPALRIELEAQGVVFRTNTDTEVLLHLYGILGHEMVHRLRGMFAFTIWDNEKRTLFLARDPYGIKPLYTANDGWTFRFASQVKALMAGGNLSNDLEPAGVVGFFLWGSVPEPFTLYREIRALPAGHTQVVDEVGPREPQPYTSITECFGQEPKRLLPAGELNDRVREAALESVRAHLLADVDVGLFLSAGIDSSALLGLMHDAGQREVRAITLGFDEFRGTSEDEVPAAAQVAQYYGAEHIVRTVSEAEFQEDFPMILAAMDQPSTDGVNTWFVAKAAREAGLKVAMSGLGGDELFAGYPSFLDIPRWVKWLRIPAAIPGAGYAARTLLAAFRVAGQSPKKRGLVDYGGTYEGAYLLRRGLFLPFELKTVLDPEIVRSGLQRLRPFQRIRASIRPNPRDTTSRIGALESVNYLRNQLLRDADWAGMAQSLEIRTPLVDIRLLNTLSPIIPSFEGGRGKRALASAPSNPLPEGIVNRPKTGFVVPTGGWMANAAAAGLDGKGAASRSWAMEVFKHSQGSTGGNAMDLVQPANLEPTAT